MKFIKAHEKAQNLIAILDEETYISYNWKLNPKETALRIAAGWYILEWDLREYFKKAKTRDEVVSIFKEKSKDYNISTRSTIDNLDNIYYI